MSNDKAIVVDEKRIGKQDNLVTILYQLYITADFIECAYT